MRNVLWLILLVCQCDQYLQTQSNPVVNTKSGRVKGLVLQSEKDEDYYGFRGIPFGKSTSGAGRFKPPQPMDPWNGIFDATRFGPECPQFNVITRGVEGTEDCLAVNVYTPELPTESPSDKLKPVLVFIHGGGFSIGTGSYTFYGAKRFMDYSVLLVTFNYRLGILGFVSTGDEASPGNYGMLDQVLLLCWVKENIANFGGDPGKVTIFGESAGGASVIYHLLSPLSKGLFHRAIAQSGSALNHWALQKHPLQWAQDVAKLVGCPTNDTWALMSCFKEKPVRDLIRKPFDLQVSTFFPIYAGPAIQQNSETSFLTENPYDLLKNGKIVNKVPLILGITEREIYSFYDDIMKQYSLKGWDHLFKEFPTILPFLFHMPSNDKDVYARVIKEYYGDLNANDSDVFDDVQVKLLSDATFGVGIAQTANLYAEAGLPTYAYVYKHLGQHTFSEIFGVHPGKHSSHADELFLQFPFCFTQHVELNDGDRKMSHMMNTLWTDFAKGQVPSIPTEEGQVHWQPLDAKNPSYLQLHLKPEMSNGKLAEKLEFWTETIPSLSKKSTVNIKNEL